MSDIGQQTVDKIERNDAHPLTEQQLWAQAEGQHAGGVARTVGLNEGNDGRIAGTPASASAIAASQGHPRSAHDETTAPDSFSERPALFSGNAPSHAPDDHKASLADKIKGQVKIAIGSAKNDQSMIQDGEDLKAGDKDRLH